MDKLNELLSVQLENLQKYLKIIGWEIEESNIKNFAKAFKNFNERKIEIHIPTNQTIDDYVSVIDSIIKSLSNIENIEYLDILEGINNIGYSLMKMRFVSKETKTGTILFNNALNAMESIKEMLTYEACSVIEPRSDYRRPFQEASILLDNCELAQTEFGSFTIKIRIPSHEIYFNKLKNKEDFIKDLGIKTVTQLISGIVDSKSIDLDNEEMFMRDYDKKLNRKVCKKISNLLIEEDGFNIDISAKWDPSKKIADNLPDFVKLDSKSDYKRFNKMVVYLEKIPEEENITVNGKIMNLRIEPKKEGEEYEKETIKIYSKEKKKNVYILLNKLDHEIACDALKQKKEINVSGILNQKENGFWYLDDPANLSIIN